ncbi:MAG: hypothetical protein KBA66_21790 [Leptospiraceae bacterium]|nr:hypothetical protein [Leptospiraceae bacterium]
MPPEFQHIEEIELPKFQINVCDIRLLAGKLRGENFPEPRFIDWNFVSFSKEKINNAKLAWKNQDLDLFGKGSRRE